MSKDRPPGSLDDLEAYGIEFVGTQSSDPRLETSGAIWVRCKTCGYNWAVRRNFTSGWIWTTCQRPDGCPSAPMPS